MNLQDHIRRFVEKSGGIEKIELAVEALKGIEDHQDYLLRISRSRAGARQLIAAALMGFTVSALVERKAQL